MTDSATATDVQTPTEPARPKRSATKAFVLDTNVLLHNAASLFMFDDNDVVLPFAVLEELDKFKKQSDDVGRNAREAIRNLDRLRGKGHLNEGVRWNGHGGTIKVEFSQVERPDAISDDTPDNRILGVAYQLQKQGRRTIVITKDINVRLKADSLGLETQDFEAERVDSDRLYSGSLDIVVPDELIDQLYEEKQIPLEDLEPYLVEESPDGDRIRLEVFGNQFVQLRGLQDVSHVGLARRLADTDHLIPVHAPRKPTYGIVARNVQQVMAMDLLLDDEVNLVTMLGTAGSGKTLLALAAGMCKVFTEQRYDKLLVARPIMPMGRDIGFLPGDKDEKLASWMQPIFDNLQYLVSTRGAGPQHADSRPVEQRVNQLVESGQLVMEALTYIRGRSIPHQFMIVDEAQNLTPHEVKTIVSRVGEGTKIVLTGDVAQIDNPYLDTSSNGLSYLVERLKGDALVGHITLGRSERSALASLAADRL